MVQRSTNGRLTILNTRDSMLSLAGAISILVVAVIDMRLQSGIPIVLAHVPIVLLGLAAHKNSVTLILAIAGTLATIIVAAGDLQAVEDIAVLATRGKTIALIWTVAILVYITRRARISALHTEDLIEKNDLFSAVFDQTFQFIAALDTDGNIVHANQTLRVYAGLTTAETDSLPLWLLPIFHGDDVAQARLQSAIAAAASGDFIRDEFIVSDIGERSTVIDLSLKPIRDTNGAVQQIIMEARDVTETRMQHEMLVQAQKMEAVGELTAGVAHDFNNLLTVIVGNLELIQKRVTDDERLSNRLDRAVKAAFRGQSLTQQLLAFSRRQSLNPMVVDINALLNGLTQLYGSLGDDVSIEFSLADDLPLCEVDPVLLETALLNIAINARDAMPDGGTLHIKTERFSLDRTYRGEISDLPPGQYVCVTVSDTGTGIPEDVIDHVFDPFYTTKQEGQGTGLGLSMVYGFVKQSGGDVKIYSEKDEGTTVRIYLPPTDKKMPVALEEPTVSGYSENVDGKPMLLVEDDDEIRDVIFNTLSEQGWQVDMAASGDDAIGLIRAGKRYDLVLTDMVMAGDAGGPEVARAARAALRDVPVIFCSGFPRNLLNGDEASVPGAFFLSKPFHEDELRRTVERALARQTG